MSWIYNQYLQKCMFSPKFQSKTGWRYKYQKEKRKIFTYRIDLLQVVYRSQAPFYSTLTNSISQIMHKQQNFIDSSLSRGQSVSCSMSNEFRDILCPDLSSWSSYGFALKLELASSVSEVPGLSVKNCSQKTSLYDLCP